MRSKVEYISLLDNKIIRLILQVFSIFSLLFIKNSYGHAAISIYNRYPIVLVMLCAILVYGFLGHSKYAVYCEILSYLSLISLLLYRIIFELEGFVTFNHHLYGLSAYVMFIVGGLLFLTLFIKYINIFIHVLVYKHKP